MDKQTTCQLIQKISKLGGSSESVQILLVECLWSSLQDLPKKLPCPHQVPSVAVRLLTTSWWKRTAPTKTIKKYQTFTSTSPTSPTFFFAFSGRQAEASADLRWARRTASARNWLEIVPPLRSWKDVFFKPLRQGFTNGTYNFWNDCFSATGDRFFLHSHIKQKKMKDTLR